MKFFIDTAMIDEIRDAASMGLVDGVTTNPSLVAKTGRSLEAVVRDIVEVVDGPISAEVVSTDYEGMLKEGLALAKIHPNVVVKCPLTMDGLKATRALRSENIGVNVTLCFSPNQALLAAKAGASYISPFVGRLDDISQDGMGLIEDILTIYDNYGFATEVLVASVRHPHHVLTAARMGAHVATIPHKVLLQLASHPLTDKGLADFLSDHKKAQAKSK